jgi:RimJ/RimL family protein N-acetyltransferase
VALPRLLLRELEGGDWEAVHAYAVDDAVVRYMPWGPNTPTQTRDFLRLAAEHRRERPRHHYDLAVVLAGRLIGACGLHVSAPELDEAFIGYALSRPFWGHGYATETARGLLALGFEKLGLHRIFAVCDPANVASARVLEKAGMRREGHLREHRWQKGQWCDSLLFAMLRREWPDAARTGPGPGGPRNPVIQ